MSETVATVAEQPPNPPGAARPAVVLLSGGLIQPPCSPW